MFQFIFVYKYYKLASFGQITKNKETSPMEYFSIVFRLSAFFAHINFNF